MKKKYLKIVPWFSWEEWNYTYKNIFGNSLDDWRNAYEQLSVWKSRISKLPIGIEGTMPLLHAQIALMDPSIDELSKNALLNMAIMKFVSIATKGVERFNFKTLKYNTMQDAASVMNFPPYLIDLRNEIVHSDSIFGTSLTLRSALESAFQWIKINYWEVEENRMLDLLNQKSLEQSSSPTTHRSLHGFSSSSEEEEDEVIEELDYSFDALKNKSREFADQIASCSVELELPEEKWTSEMVDLIKEIDLAFCNNSDSCFKVVVKDLFYSHHFVDLLEKDSDTLCPCGSSLPVSIATNLSFIINHIRKLCSINLFIDCLIKKSEDLERPELCIEWIRILCNTVYSHKDRSRCPHHIFRLPSSIDLNSFGKEIKWRRIIYHLFCLKKPWASNLGIEISLTGSLRNTFSTRKAIKKLSELYYTSELNNSKKKKKSIDPATLFSNDVRGVEDLLKEAKKISPKTFDYLSEVSSIMCIDGEPKGKKRKIDEMMLGQLPHQRQHPDFFLQMILSPSASCDTSSLVK